VSPLKAAEVGERALKTKVFISWSGQRSKAIALALRVWIPRVLQTVEPFVSDKDIDAGRRWSDEIARELEDSSFGIICVTPENQKEPWLLFEAGALAKHAKTAKVIPYLHGGLDFAHLAGSPLAAFQGAKQSGRDGTYAVISSLNKELASPLPEGPLIETFDMWWSKLNESLHAADVAHSEPAPKPPTVEQQLSEVLGAVFAVGDEVRHLSTQLLLRQNALPGSVARSWNVPATIQGVETLERVLKLAEEAHASENEYASRRTELLERLERSSPKEKT